MTDQLPTPARDLVAYVNRRNAAGLERDADLLAVAIALLAKHGAADLSQRVEAVQDDLYERARALTKGNTP